MHYDRLKPYIPRPGQRDPFARDHDAPPESDGPADTSGDGHLPTLDADDPMLGFLAEEEEDLLAWEELHSSSDRNLPKKSRLTVKFNPTSPPITPPTTTATNDEPEEIVDLTPRPPPGRAVRQERLAPAPPPRAASGPARFTRARSLRQGLWSGLKAPFKKKWT